MAHADGDHHYRHLGRKIDGQVRTPWNKGFYSLIAALYTPDEVELVLKMPNGLSTLDRVQEVTLYDRTQLQVMLDRSCTKWLAIDVSLKGEYRFMLAPMVIGSFEFMMMRTGDDLPSKESRGQTALPLASVPAVTRKS